MRPAVQQNPAQSLEWTWGGSGVRPTGGSSTAIAACEWLLPLSRAVALSTEDPVNRLSDARKPVNGTTADGAAGNVLLVAAGCWPCLAISGILPTRQGPS